MDLIVIARSEATKQSSSLVVPGWSEGPDLRCAIAHRGTSRFSDAQVRTLIRSFYSRPGMTVRAGLLRYARNDEETGEPAHLCKSAHPTNRHPPLRRRNRCRVETAHRLPAMQRLADFADRKECAGARLFRFQGLLAAALHERDQVVQGSQTLGRRLALRLLQRFEHPLCGFTFTHERSFGLFKKRGAALIDRRPAGLFSPQI